MLELSILGIAGVLNIFLGTAVYLKNPRSATNRLFLFFTLSFTTWSIANYISVHPMLFSQVVWVRIVLALAALLCLSAYLTFTVYPSRALVGSPKVRRRLTIATFAVMAFVLSPFVFVLNEQNEPVPTPGIAVFLVLVGFLLGGGLFNLVKKFRRSFGQERRQLRLVLTGLIAAFGLILLTNFLLVVLFNFTGLIALGPTYMLIFSGVMAYGIIKHRLFSMRMVIARALGYLTSIAIMVLFYSLFTQYLFQLLPDYDSFLVTVLANSILVIFIVLTYQPLKAFFDKQTKRVFFRDAYDPQVFLDRLNDTLVGNIELGILLRHTASVIEDNLKADCHIYVKEVGDAPARIMGTTNRMNIDRETMELIKSEMATLQEKTVAADDLEDHYVDLKKALDENNIAVISSLITNYSTNQEATAYLLLGHKKSGYQYNRQDLRIINIISDELLIAIQNALRFEEIQSFNVTLQNRIHEATAKLKRSNEKLKEMDETKDEFISMASHQLRTPLTSVKGYLSMVLDGDAGKISDNQKQLLNQAFVSSQRMVYMIADLLNVSRLKTGKFVIDSAPTNLADTVESEIAQLTEVAKSRKLNLTYDKPKNFPTLMLDETKTRQVVMNFIDNAIYYTPAEGKIKVELHEDADSVYFTVTDNGLGVPKSEQAHLFSKFYRAKNAQKARPDGTGLGLFMAKKVITEQGGTILFESTEGKGSTFGFKFDKPKTEADKPSKEEDFEESEAEKVPELVLAAKPDDE